MLEESANQFGVSPEGINLDAEVIPNAKLGTYTLLRISQLNDFEPKVRDFVGAIILNGATQVELDSAGRLLLPKTLMEYAGLEKDIVLVSAVTKIEIWDKSKYKSASLTIFHLEALIARLANDVMNKKAG